MFNAILEITIMLLGAFGIGLLAARQFWIPKLMESREKEQESHRQAVKAEIDSKKELKRTTGLREHYNRQLKEQRDTNIQLEELTITQGEKIRKLESEVKSREEKISSLKQKIKDAEEGLKPVDQSKVKEAVRVIKAERSKVSGSGSGSEKSKRETTDEMKESSSYYEVIEGRRYDKAILDATREAVKGRGDGRISIEDAQKIYKAVEDADQYTEVEKESLKYIRDHFNWTEASDQWFRKSVRSWAAKRGWEKLKES